MPVLRQPDAVVFEMHGSRFLSYVKPSRGSNELCAWRLSVPAHLHGAAHRPTRDEILLVVAGQLHVTIDGATTTIGPGDVVLVAGGAEFRVDGGPEGGEAWVTTTPRLEAVLADGSRIAPPWAN